MQITIEWTRDNLKKVLKQKRNLPNIIILVIGILLYAYITYYGYIFEEFDNLKLFLGFLAYLAILIGFLYLTTILYVHVRLKRNDKRTKMAYGKYIIKLDDEKILSIFNNQKISYKWRDIVKFKKRKKYFFLRTKNDFIGLTFRKSELKDDYDKILNYVTKKLAKN